MSLLNLLKKKTYKTLFTTPSHGQKFFILNKFRQFYTWDISETDAHDPQAALEKAQEKAAEIYKTKKTLFLTNGSTSGIIAAVLACVNEKKDKVLIWKDSHICHKNALELAGASPVFYEYEQNKEWGIQKPLSAEYLEEFLEKEKIKAVIITSPTYEGVVSDIEAISEVCKKHGAYLIVDEAHGALYPFCDKLPKSAIYQEADFVVQSLHKTAGGLNPTAVLHSNCELDIENALSKISTTSPSYPLLASIEKNINYLNSKKGRKKILELVENIEKMKKNVSNAEFYAGDATKIVVKTKNLTGYDLSEKLFELGIEDEKTNEVSTMLLCGLGTDEKNLEKLEKALKRILR